MLIIGTVNLNKVDQSKIIKAKNGDLLLEMAIWVNDKTDRYGEDVAIQHTLTSAERLTGEKAKFIGHGNIKFKR